MIGKKKILGVIPARYASTRLAAKALAMIGDRSMVMRVYQQALNAGVLDYLVVATDDARIYDHVIAMGGMAVMTSADHSSGTSRCLEALHKTQELRKTTFDVVINIQGDEPFLDPDDITLLADIYQNSYDGIASLAAPISNEDDIQDPNVVKVVCDEDGNALYFSRSPIPYLRNVKPGEWVNHHMFLKHHGIYAYTSALLQDICKLSDAALEKAESLEQLRWLSFAYPIKMLISKNEAIGIDTAEDLEKAKEYIREREV